MSITVTTHRHCYVAELRFARPPLNFASSESANGPLAVLSVRRTWLGGLADDVAKAMAHEHARQSELRGIADFAEGVAAVFERRPANFTGK